MKKMLILALIFAMMMSWACAQIKSTGSVTVRSGPGLDYDVIGTIAKGEVAV